MKTPGANRYMPQTVETRTVPVGDISATGMKDVLTPEEERRVKTGMAADAGLPPAAPSRHQLSIKMKNEAAEKLAQKQEDELAALFDTPELSEENENPAVNGTLDHHSENAPRAGSASSQPKVALNRKAKVSQGTAEIVPQSAAEVKRRIQTYRNGDIKVRVNDVPTLLRDIGALFKMRYMGRSRYATYEAKIGNILFRLVAIRVITEGSDNKAACLAARSASSFFSARHAHFPSALNAAYCAVSSGAFAL